MSDIPVIEKNLMRKYEQSGPRYTSYPPAVHFHEGFNDFHFKEIIRQTNEDLVPSPLSLYIHIPFCRHVCFYCACNRIITNNKKRATGYLDKLYAEIIIKGKLFDSDRVVEQLHLGGGTPNFLDDSQLYKLMEVIRDNFTLVGKDQGDYSIELDPREINEETIPNLRDIGFNRISIGVQDFDSNVQNQINRIQSVEQTEYAVVSARNEKFDSINIDLIYGLPGQTVKSFLETLKIVSDLRPDRLAIYNYAHLPQLFKSQRMINEALLPDAETRLEILQQSVNFLSNAGYNYIGMDHFALPDDELAVAQKSGSLYRNFQGYTTRSDCDLVGLGITAISSIADCYAQNTRSLEDYKTCLDNKKIPVIRGIKLDKDDLLRRNVINSLICNFRVRYSDIEDQHCIEFHDYFYDELISLREMEKHGLLFFDNDAVNVTPKGRFLVRNICMVFDKYLQTNRFKGTYSRTV